MLEKFDQEKMNQMAKEVSGLYAKAQTKAEYENLMYLSRKYADVLTAHMVLLNEILPVIFSGYWAEYHLFDKFSSGFTEEDIKKFAKKIGMLRSRLTKGDTDDNMVALLYLESNIWSHLLNDQEKAKQCIAEMNRIISRGKISIASILKMINSAGNKEMDAKNWARAVEIFDRINKYSQEILEKPENILYAANIFNQRGASKNRGKIDPIEGATDILLAAHYYSQQAVPAAKHFGGLPNRLQESLNNMQSMTLGYGVVKHGKIYGLISEAKDLLKTVSEEIEQKKPAEEYFETLRVKIKEIREQILEAKYGKRI